MFSLTNAIHTKYLLCVCKSATAHVSFQFRNKALPIPPHQVNTNTTKGEDVQCFSTIQSQNCVIHKLWNSQNGDHDDTTKDQLMPIIHPVWQSSISVCKKSDSIQNNVFLCCHLYHWMLWFLFTSAQFSSWHVNIFGVIFSLLDASGITAGKGNQIVRLSRYDIISPQQPQSSGNSKSKKHREVLPPIEL